MSENPETILQFGAGGFLRAFVDLFVYHAQQRGDALGGIVVVQTTGDGRAKLLNEQHGRYHVVIRGIDHGQVIDRVEECVSIGRALAAQRQWDQVLAVARSADLKYIVSNTTEVGYSLDSPYAFPRLLHEVLLARWRARQPPVTVMPCELMEDNAERLAAIVGGIAVAAGDPIEFVDWLKQDCIWLCSLVDRIVPGRPDDHPLAAGDPLLLEAEPYALWALQSKPGAHPWFEHPNIVRDANIQPYFLRKVRILNAAHTAIVGRLGIDCFATVQQAMSDGPTVEWLHRLLFDEIVPVLDGRCTDPAGFARNTIERLRNPFLRHRLADIAVNHAAKLAIRLRPSLEEYRIKFCQEPALLAACCSI